MILDTWRYVALCGRGRGRAKGAWKPCQALVVVSNPSVFPGQRKGRLSAMVLGGTIGFDVSRIHDGGACFFVLYNMRFTTAFADGRTKHSFSSIVEKCQLQLPGDPADVARSPGPHFLLSDTLLFRLSFSGEATVGTWISCCNRACLPARNALFPLPHHQPPTTTPTTIPPNTTTTNPCPPP